MDYRITSLNGKPAMLPGRFFCILTDELMTDPVRASDGYVYEREPFEEWLTYCWMSPTTGLELSSTDLIIENGLKAEIDQWAAGPPTINIHVHLWPGITYQIEATLIHTIQHVVDTVKGHATDIIMHGSNELDRSIRLDSIKPRFGQPLHLSLRNKRHHLPTICEEAD